MTDLTIVTALNIMRICFIFNNNYIILILIPKSIMSELKIHVINNLMSYRNILIKINLKEIFKHSRRIRKWILTMK